MLEMLTGAKFGHSKKVLKGLVLVQGSEVEDGRHLPFSLFHHSPVAQSGHAMNSSASTQASQAQSSYSLFGSGPAQAYPLAPLLHGVR